MCSCVCLCPRIIAKSSSCSESLANRRRNSGRDGTIAPPHHTPGLNILDYLDTPCSGFFDYQDTSLPEKREPEHPCLKSGLKSCGITEERKAQIQLWIPRLKLSLGNGAARPLNTKEEARFRSNAQCRLALHYERGGDQIEAAKWWKMAADQGDPSAMIALADMYDHGRGVPEDPVQATGLLLRVANAFFSTIGTEVGTQMLLQENPAPLLKLGERFESGHGVRQDLVEAYRWFDLVAGRYCCLNLDGTGRTCGFSRWQGRSETR